MSSLFRIRPILEMPNEFASCCNSGISMDARPLPPRRRRVPVVSDVMSVVSLNGFLPSNRRAFLGTARV